MNVPHLAEVSDNDLIEQFLQGSEESFEELISRYETKAYNLAMRLTRNEDDAEEVLQDVFVTLYRKLKSFEGKSAFSSWLYRITANASFMKLRKRKNKVMLSLDDLQPGMRLHEAVDQTFYARTDSMVLSKELRAAIESAIDRLPEDYRAVFLLRDMNGLPNKEVAEILDISVPAVKSRLHRSRMMLRRRLRRWYEMVRESEPDFIATQQRHPAWWTAA
ncbi:MAG: sigma-70 family RNA polymerase sigma factor [Bdellovibrionales bacterium]|nr:sigma-70 family RNA polymerase sigma factor [Bdellovibrionales bacterium]